MREIKFRGKRIDNGQWITGYLMMLDKEQMPNLLIGEDTHSMRGVDPNTIGQFTGLKDKNGSWIYEGDHFGNNSFPVYVHEGAFKIEGISLIEYLNGETIEEALIIRGNIHENPEIIEKQKVELES